MKKNAMMRIASLVLVLTLLSTCAISGTFAKYVTSDSASDTARVAKFGVVLNATGNSGFDVQYKTHDTKYNAAMSVIASTNADNTQDKVVAPGTSSADLNTTQTYSISGTPEVATKVDISMTVTEDIWLLKEDNSKYCPVVFTLKQTQGKYLPEGATDLADISEEGIVLKSGTLTDIQDFLSTYSGTAYYAPNTDLAASFELSWAWAFETGTDADPDANDVYDTTLGDLAAGVKCYKADGTTELVDGTDYNLEIKYEITFTVTQVD